MGIEPVSFALMSPKFSSYSVPAELTTAIDRLSMSPLEKRDTRWAFVDFVASSMAGWRTGGVSEKRLGRYGLQLHESTGCFEEGERKGMVR